jgi:hypothetical protein
MCSCNCNYTTRNLTFSQWRWRRLLECSTLCVCKPTPMFRRSWLPPSSEQQIGSSATLASIYPLTWYYKIWIFIELHLQITKIFTLVLGVSMMTNINRKWVILAQGYRHSTAQWARTHLKDACAYRKYYLFLGRGKLSPPKADETFN